MIAVKVSFPLECKRGVPIPLTPTHTLGPPRIASIRYVVATHHVFGLSDHLRRRNSHSCENSNPAHKWSWSRREQYCTQGGFGRREQCFAESTRFNQADHCCCVRIFIYTKSFYDNSIELYMPKTERMLSAAATVERILKAHETHNTNNAGCKDTQSAGLRN